MVYSLKCSIPVLEGLIPEPHGSGVMDLLFTLAHWHALAKLRQHTDLSLEILQSVTILLGKLLRGFQQNICSKYDTRELKREVASRLRRTANQSTTSKSKSAATESDAKSGPTTGTGSSESLSTSKSKTVGRQCKTFNLNTYKDHSIGDYVETIRTYGTVDSYSTESVGCSYFLPFTDTYLNCIRWS